jgi:hypothetical protein
MKQYRITSDHINQGNSDDDAFLDPSDPIHELKVVQYLAGLGGEARLQEYRAKKAQHEHNINQGSNISLTGNEKAQIQRENNIRPGTPEWFQLWFSRPYMTGEKPLGK